MPLHRLSVITTTVAAVVFSASPAIAAAPSAKSRAVSAVIKEVKKHQSSEDHTFNDAEATCKAITAKRFNCEWTGLVIGAGEICTGQARVTVYSRGADVRLRNQRC